MISVNVYLCILAFVVSMSSQTESAENSTLIATAMVCRNRVSWVVRDELIHFHLNR